MQLASLDAVLEKKGKNQWRVDAAIGWQCVNVAGTAGAGRTASRGGTSLLAPSRPSTLGAGLEWLCDQECTAFRAS